MTITADQIENETDVTWLAPTCTLPRYVRATLVRCYRRRGMVKHSGRVVGWANLSKRAKSDRDGFQRRVFWLAAHDPYEGGGAPVEAIDPLTVSPGIVGELNARAAGKVGCR